MTDPLGTTPARTATTTGLDDAGAPVAPPGLAPGSLPAAGVTDASSRRIKVENLRLLVKKPTFVVGSLIFLWWVVCAIWASSFVPYNPDAQNFLLFNAAPSAHHLFGTDRIGRDVLSRVLVGAQSILVIAPLATLVGTAVGSIIGLFQGYFRGVLDNLLGRLVDAALAIPGVMVAFIFIVGLGSSNETIILVIGFIFAILISRTVRTAVLQERELDYVAAAKLRGENAFHIMFVEILPNVFGPILVEFTVRLGYAIFWVATLSFLGFGVQPPTPSWGTDMAYNYGQLSAGYWWETVFFALAIASLVVSVNLISDSMNEVLVQ